MHCASATTPPKEARATAIGDMHKKLGEDRTCSFEDMIADRQTHRQTNTLITILRFPYPGRSNNRRDIGHGRYVPVCRRYAGQQCSDLVSGRACNLRRKHCRHRRVYLRHCRCISAQWRPHAVATGQPAMDTTPMKFNRLSLATHHIS